VESVFCSAGWFYEMTGFGAEFGYHWFLNY